MPKGPKGHRHPASMADDRSIEGATSEGPVRTRTCPRTEVCPETPVASGLDSPVYGYFRDSFSIPPAVRQYPDESPIFIQPDASRRSRIADDAGADNIA